MAVDSCSHMRNASDNLKMLQISCIAGAAEAFASRPPQAVVSGKLTHGHAL